MEIEKGELRMVALDGFRLSLRQTSLESDYSSMSAVVPSTSLGEIGKIMDAGGEEKARITLTDSHLFIHVGSTKFVTRLLEGEFIRYRQILPTDWQTRILVDVRQIAQAIDRASTLAREGRNNPIRFSIAGSQLQIRSNSEQGNNREIVPVQLEGKEIEIAFNARYLSDVFKILDAREVYLCFTTNVSPCVIRPAEGEDFLYLVLPVRVYTQ
jgi:DNA polymerase-3 subunit beta